MQMQDQCLCCSNTHPGRRPLVRAAVGLALLTAGAVMILVNTGVVDGTVLEPYWPVPLVMIGLAHLAPPVDGRAFLTAVAWIVAGGVFLVSNLGIAAFDPIDLWPLILVYIGLGMILRRFGSRSLSTRGGSRPDSRSQSRQEHAND